MKYILYSECYSQPYKTDNPEVVIIGPILDDL